MDKYLEQNACLTSVLMSTFVFQVMTFKSWRYPIESAMHHCEALYLYIVLQRIIKTIAGSRYYPTLSQLFQLLSSNSNAVRQYLVCMLP